MVRSHHVILGLPPMGRATRREEIMSEIKFGNFVLQTEDVPAATQHRMLSSAFAHIMGNEVASTVVARIRKAVAESSPKSADGKERKPDSVTRDEIEAYRKTEAGASQIEKWEDELRAAKLAAILDGTLAVRTARAPSRDPVETASRAIAKAEVMAILKQNGAKFPGKDETVSIGGQEVTGDDLIDRRLTNHGERIGKLAERKVADDKRLRDATTKATSGESAGLAESLGL